VAAKEVYRLQGCSLWKAVVGPRASPSYRLTYLRLSSKERAQTQLGSYQLVIRARFSVRDFPHTFHKKFSLRIVHKKPKKIVDQFCYRNPITLFSHTSTARVGLVEFLVAPVCVELLVLVLVF
jgi:hypothetical protein